MPTEMPGEPRWITDATGATTAEHLYLPSGKEATNPTETAEVTKFTPHERDFHPPYPPIDLTDPLGRHPLGNVSDDLDYMHARYFSPHLGRFMSVDPITQYDAIRTPQLYNRYSYALGNPLKYLDPDGLRPLRANELQFFNAFFGADFSTVDLKSGLVANTITSVAGALGVTLGENIFLSPRSSRAFDQGNKYAIALVGHELTHVLQYRALGVGKFLDLYVANYSFNRSKGQPDQAAYRNIVVEEIARNFQRRIKSFLDQNPEIGAKLESGETFSNSELDLISSALQDIVLDGEVFKEGYQIIQGELVRIEFSKE